MIREEERWCVGYVPGSNRVWLASGNPRDLVVIASGTFEAMCAVFRLWEVICRRG